MGWSYSPLGWSIQNAGHRNAVKCSKWKMQNWRNVCFLRLIWPPVEIIYYYMHNVGTATKSIQYQMPVKFRWLTCHCWGQQWQCYHQSMTLSVPHREWSWIHSAPGCLAWRCQLGTLSLTLWLGFLRANYHSLIIKNKYINNNKNHWLNPKGLQQLEPIKQSWRQFYSNCLAIKRSGLSNDQRAVSRGKERVWYNKETLIQHRQNTITNANWMLHSHSPIQLA